EDRTKCGPKSPVNISTAMILYANGSPPFATKAPSSKTKALNRIAERMQSPERPSKQEAFLAFLQGGWTSLHLDARRPAVVVPAHLRGEAHLVLQYGHDLPIPIPDLEVDEDGVRATLSFSKTPQRTFVPWEAVYVVACVDGRGVLYHEDVPEDVSIIAAKPPGDGAAFDDAPETADGSDPVGGAPAGRNGVTARFLRSVPEDGAAPKGDGDGAGDGQAELHDRALPSTGVRRRRRPQLRLVK